MWGDEWRCSWDIYEIFFKLLGKASGALEGSLGGKCRIEGELHIVNNITVVWNQKRFKKRKLQKEEY